MSIDTIDLSSLRQTLTVRVKKPEQTIFEGKAIAVTTKNGEGIFDVVPFHTNFISLIKETLIIHESKDKKIELPIQGGIMKVFENNVYIYLGIKTLS